MNLRISLVEEDTAVRKELEAAVNASESFVLASTHRSLREASAYAVHARPDIVVVGYPANSVTGQGVGAGFRALLPAVKVVVINRTLTLGAFGFAAELGADGYVEGTPAAASLFETLARVAGGEVVFAGRTVTLVREALWSICAARRMQELLTWCEQQVIELVADGFRTSEIARRTNVAEETVHTHVAHILTKLECRTRAQAIARYLGWRSAASSPAVEPTRSR